MDVMRSEIYRGLSGFTAGELDPVILLVVSALDPRPTTDHPSPYHHAGYQHIFSASATRNKNYDHEAEV
jgi:hypothetical protein